MVQSDYELLISVHFKKVKIFLVWTSIMTNLKNMKKTIMKKKMMTSMITLKMKMKVMY